jgi:hypothetical protein
MSSNDTKPIKFIYQTDEYVLNVGQSIPVERLLDQVKTHFDIQSDNSLDFIDIDTNMGLAPGSTRDFWDNITEKMPVYRIKVKKSKEFYILRKKRR